MNKRGVLLIVPAVVLSCSLTHTIHLSAAEQAGSLVLLNFDGRFDISSVITSDVKVTPAQPGGLRIETGHKERWPGITLKAPAGKWDLSKCEYVCVDVKNVAAEPVTVSCRVDNPGTDGNKNCVADSITLAGGREGTLTVRIFPVPWKLSKPLELIGMRASPVYSDKVDTSNVTQILVFVNGPQIDHAFEIRNLRAGGSVAVLDAETFCSFIDEFGQFVHSNWPGKTHSLDELIASIAAEQEDLGAHSGPADRNGYGGWTAGPKLDATGFFRVQKYQGKWWLVDPEGRLFWSHGIDCVRSENATPVSDREHYFRNLPEPGSPFAEFYGQGAWAPHGYYHDHSPYKTYDFSQANFLRKYGRNWRGKFAVITHQRLKSWGMNTIANWSDPNIYLMRKTPYFLHDQLQCQDPGGLRGLLGQVLRCV